jgi:hypothetical protein
MTPEEKAHLLYLLEQQKVYLKRAQVTLDELEKELQFRLNEHWEVVNPHDA